MKKQLSIIFHSQTGHTRQLAEAVWAGASKCNAVESALYPALEANHRLLFRCSGLLIGTPENFGYMAGAVKDFFDRTYLPCKDRLRGLPFAVFVSAGNDGSGAVREIERIARGYGWKSVMPSLIIRGEVDQSARAQAVLLGETMAEAIAIGAF